MLADYGIRDEQLTECFGNCSVLDNAIRYYLDLDSDDTYDDEDEQYNWEE